MLDVFESMKSIFEVLDSSARVHALTLIIYFGVAFLTRIGVTVARRHRLQSALTAILEGLSNQDLKARAKR
jgi:hypothetical protein